MYSFDVSDLVEGKIFIEAIVLDSSGNACDSCVNQYMIDHTAPVAITDLKANGSNGNVHVTWTVGEADTEHYCITDVKMKKRHTPK